MAKAGPAGPIAYLTGEYPAVSHTFILREIEALRAQGLTVETASVRRTEAKHHRGPAEQNAAATTFYVLSAARNPATLVLSIGAALARPGRLFAAIRLAWQTRAPGLGAALYQLFYLVEAMVLSRHLRARGIVHLHNHFANSSCSVAMLTSALSGIPFSFTLHGPAIFFEPERWRIDAKIARARFVACISHFCRSQGMIFADPADWPKMRIVHCGVTPERYGTQSHPPDHPPGQQVVFVGRLAAVKGVRVLLEAFARARARHPQARLTLIGDGEERADIEAHAASLGLEDALTFTGYLSQDEVAEALGQADIFALPSFAEGVPVVLMEAMASRLPVVATRVAGIPELVCDGETGYVVAPGDVEAFAAALDRLLGDNDAGRRMGEAGRHRVEAEFDITREAAWMAQLITEGPRPETGLRPDAATTLQDAS